MPDLKRQYSHISTDPFPNEMTITLGEQILKYKKRAWDIGGETRGLRYGDNPDQPAALYQLVSGCLEIGGISWRAPGSALVSGISEKQMLQAGKHPGKTNLTDVDNGINVLQYLTDKPACVILKHNNPCGAAWSDQGITAAFQAAFWSDRIAAFGGAIVINRPATKEMAELAARNYFEVIAAPAYEAGSLELLEQRKNLRIIQLPGLAELASLRESAFLDIKSLADGGIIIQKSFQNRIAANELFMPATAKGPDGLEVSARFPSRAELDDLRFAWAVEAGTASNSAIFAKDGATLAIAAGGQDRVGAVELAISKAYLKFADALAYKGLGLSIYELRKKDDADSRAKLAQINAETAEARGGLPGSRLISDGFFPFRDGVDAAIAQNVAAIAHPGGSLRDWESIIACNEATPQVAMAFTGQRSFRH